MRRRSPGGPQPADHPDLRQRPRDQALFAQRRPAGLLEGAVEEDGRREGHPREELRGPVVAQAPGCVHPVEPRGRAGEQPDEHARAEGGVAVAGLADGEYRAEHGGAVETEGDQVLPASGEVEVLSAEADQSVEGERGGDRRAAEEQNVRSAPVDGFLAPPPFLAALPAVVRRGLLALALASGQYRNCRKYAQDQQAAGQQPVQRYVGQSHADVPCLAYAAMRPCGFPGAIVA